MSIEIKPLKAFTFEHPDAGTISLVYRDGSSYDSDLGKYGRLYSCTTMRLRKTRAEALGLLTDGIAWRKESPLPASPSESGEWVSSAYTMDQVWAPVEAHYRAQVQYETFGHLAPEKDRAYRGRIVYAVGCFGNDTLNPTPILCEFDGLDSSPWFYDALLEFVGDGEFGEGCVYEFVGTFRNYEFLGKKRLILNVSLPTAPDESGEGVS